MGAGAGVGVGTGVSDVPGVKKASAGGSVSAGRVEALSAQAVAPIPSSASSASIRNILRLFDFIRPPWAACAAGAMLFFPSIDKRRRFIRPGGHYP